jgi:ABC-type nitrate/sulfonate/bicarbonate transport system ATPase subunit
LRPFEAADRRVFFGRDRDVERLAALLRSPVQRADAAPVAVVGPSGCGKSSLVRVSAYDLIWRGAYDLTS